MVLSPSAEERPSRGQALYIQIALYACGNALAIIIGLIIYNLWNVLSDFRDPMLYALLCSIALRSPKDWLVKHMEARLSQDRTLAWALLSVLSLPLTALRETYEEARDLLLKWRQNVAELQHDLQRRQALWRVSTAAPGAASPATPKGTPLTTPTSPRSPLSPRTRVDASRVGALPGAAGTATAAHPQAAAAVPATHRTTLPVLLSVYAKAGVRALRTRRTSKKRKRRAKMRAAVPSAVLFRWLWRVCVAWLVYEWLRAVWSATLQLAVLVTTAVLALGSLPLLYFAGHWYLASNVFTPLKSTVGRATQDRGSGFTTPTRSSVTPLRRPRFTPASRTASRGKLASGWGRTQAPSGRLLPKSPPPSPETLDSGAEGAGHQHGGGPGAAGATAAARAAWWAVARAWLGAASGTCADLLRSGDALLRAGLRRNLHALVSLLLIAGLLVGSTCLGAFLTVQVVQEGRAAVLSVRDVFPTAWAGVAIAPPLPATAAAAAAVSAAAGAGASSAGVCEVQQAAEALGLPPAGGGPLCPVPGPALPPPPPPAAAAAAAAAAEGAVAAAGGPGAPRAAPVAAPTPGMAAPGSAGPARGAAMSQPARALKGWLAPYQSEAQGLIQRSLPGLATWVEGQFDDFMARHNLTAAAGDLRLLYETVQGPRKCSPKERGRLLVAVARADLELSYALQREKEAYSRAERLKLRLTSAVQQMVRARNLPPLEGAPQQGGRSGCTEPPCMPGGSGEDEAAAAGVALTDAAADAEAAPAPSRLQQAAAFFFPSQQQAQAGEEAEAGAAAGAGGGDAAAAAAEGDGLGEAAAGAAGRAGARGSQAGQRAGGPAASASALRIMHLEQEVVAADAELAAAKAAHKAALEAAAAAQREAQAAEGRLQLCRAKGEGQEGEGGGGPQHLLPGLAGDVGRRLQSAYARLWHRQFREGWAEMRGVAQLCLDALRNATAHVPHPHPHRHHPGQPARQGDGMAAQGHHPAPGAAGVSADLGSLQRLLLVAADPLITAGRALAGVFALSVGSTTAAAVMGGLGVLRLGLGLAKFGMQLMLFLALLFYMLTAQREPLVHVVAVLPLSEGGKARAAAAFNKALGGVFISSLKLVAFHGTFTWLTFRMFAVPLAYTATVACAACALLPFIPTYVIALPACAMFVAQGHLVSGLLFFVLHFAAYYLGDTLILEDIPGGHPYLMSLGILGGIYTFDNPLQGCLLGPILLSLLSVFYNLHSEFMSAPGGAPASEHRAAPVVWSAGSLGVARRHHHAPRVVIASPATPTPSPASYVGGPPAGTGPAPTPTTTSTPALARGMAAGPLPNGSPGGQQSELSAVLGGGPRAPWPRAPTPLPQQASPERRAGSGGGVAMSLEESISLSLGGAGQRSGSSQRAGAGEEVQQQRPGEDGAESEWRVMPQSPRSQRQAGAAPWPAAAGAQSSPTLQQRQQQQRFVALVEVGEDFSFDGQNI